VDEFGTIGGIVTLEDVLEELLGEIGDEHDEMRRIPEPDQPVLEVDGSISIRDLETEYGIQLISDAGFETLAGFLLFQLGEIPQVGQNVEFAGRRYTVTEMERNRIARVIIEKVAA
jgi:CBS domain containing-hemolysin-like protein